MENWKKWHEEYENSSEEFKENVDMIFNKVEMYCLENNVKLAMDDRAEEFISDITKYIINSK